MKLFERGVEMGLESGDDSAVWKVHEDLMLKASEEGEIFKEGKVVEVGDEPSHTIVLGNQYTRVMYVSFPPSHSTLPHVHLFDSVYIFLSEGGAKVENLVKGTGCMHDFMEFGEVRYGIHSTECPLVHRITSSSETAVNCFDVEVRSPPPSRTGKVEVEEIEGHEIVKVREKIRVFKKVLKAGEEYVRDYDFFHVIVVGSSSTISSSLGWTTEPKKGTASWHEPSAGRGVTYKNEGKGDFLIYIVQFREGWKA